MIDPLIVCFRLLTGQKIETLNDAWKAVNIFHSWGTRTVVLSSTDLGDSEHLLGLASSIKSMFINSNFGVIISNQRSGPVKNGL